MNKYCKTAEVSHTNIGTGEKKFYITELLQEK